ncbi:hypothetical protein PVT67_05405 [Gallaecimonas kandeliae]|uniref:hypothetical protein n=1 Tax=Gallaecimonas kandeliae TaxID=3029055 RepID=UPI0026481A6F|nr:hypothetical protein [Gallaecimonas kandeliae]WKE66681.1 hypothetical protein PVT67_05405 [Gallaecimonas kandeliae]
MTLSNNLLRVLSATLALAGVAFIWVRVAMGQSPGHGGLSLMLLAVALCVVHAVGWQCRAQWERWLFQPPLPWLLWLLALFLCA